MTSYHGVTFKNGGLTHPKFASQDHIIAEKKFTRSGAVTQSHDGNELEIIRNWPCPPLIGEMCFDNKIASIYVEDELCSSTKKIKKN